MTKRDANVYNAIREIREIDTNDVKHLLHHYANDVN